jgi:eukaryotic-like serine/threonine-protein kinase
VEKSIYFRDGEPIFVQSNRKEELLGHFLRSRDLITEDQLEQGLERLSEWGGRLGDALVAIGAIPAHSIFEHLSAQMREKLLEIFTWDGGKYGYFENQEPDTQAYSLGVDTYEILVEGCRAHVSIDDIRKRYEHRSFVAIYTNDPPPFRINRLGLRARELRVLNQLEPGDNLETLIDKFSPVQEEMIYRMIYLFHQAELITFEVTEKFDTPPLPEK